MGKSVGAVPLFMVMLIGFLMPIALAGHDYSQALSKGILSYEAQRSGVLPRDQRVNWRSTSGRSDGKLNGVGDGDSDHYCWQRPEDMTTSRTAYKIDPSRPDSDLAGETAAAMAAASIVFRHSNPAYSNDLTHACQGVCYAPQFMRWWALRNKGTLEATS